MAAPELLKLPVRGPSHRLGIHLLLSSTFLRQDLDWLSLVRLLLLIQPSVARDVGGILHRVTWPGKMHVEESSREELEKSVFLGWRGVSQVSVILAEII